MENDKLENIEKQIKRAARYAERIMEGETSYDGADGARTVLEVCDLAEELINALREPKL